MMKFAATKSVPFQRYFFLKTILYYLTVYFNAYRRTLAAAITNVGPHISAFMLFVAKRNRWGVGFILASAVQ